MVDLYRRKVLETAAVAGLGVGTASAASNTAVRIHETNAPVDGGDVLEVTAAVENGTDTEARPPVELSVDGEPTAGTQYASIGPGETAVFELSYRTYPVERDTEISARVDAGGASAAETVTVRGVGELATETASPGDDVTVRPGTTVMFETGADVDGSAVHWYRDGAYDGDSFGPRHAAYSTSYCHQTFESAGTHEVALCVAEDEGTRRTDWEVTVTPDGPAGPAIEDARPDPDEPLASGETHELELDVTDPKGELDRVVWWLTGADAVLDVSDVSGRSDTASVETGGAADFSVVAWVLDERNVVTERTLWTFDDAADSEPTHTLSVTKDGAADGFSAFVVSVDGTLEPRDDSEAVIQGETALDWLGPKSGTDSVEFTGDISQFACKGAATVSLDGETVAPSDLGTDDSGDEANDLPNTLTLRKGDTREGRCVCSVTVSGDVERTGDSEAVIQGSTALDWVGPGSGVDTVRFSGEITDLLVKGPGVVELNGERVDPDAF